MIDPDVPILREHFRDVTRWVIGDAVGEQLTAAQSDGLADEIAVILASGLTPVLRREVELQTEKTIVSLQNGPLSFNHNHELMVDGFTVPDLLKLLDAVGRLVDTGVGEAISGLHDTHQRMLYRAHDAWLAKNPQAADSTEGTAP
ncbi:hypothetical protein GCM10009839_61250 [Catenulispora yoronensis]|uniref:Uncharacterized protein n=1 Tax=Catenulispora yoronensis TaxID=450799 RepID=A0ABP5GMA6_9ACTN